MFEVPKHIIFDNVGGDSVAINLINGAYYSLTSTGSKIMEKAREGLRIEEDKVLVALLSEGLIVSPDQPQNIGEPEDLTIAFEKFTDLESMLSADPIHDVDERGWPRLQ